MKNARVEYKIVVTPHTASNMSSIISASHVYFYRLVLIALTDGMEVIWMSKTVYHGYRTFSCIRNEPALK